MRGHVPRNNVRTDWLETVESECDTTKTVDKEQGDWEVDEDGLCNRAGRRERAKETGGGRARGERGEFVNYSLSAATARRKADHEAEDRRERRGRGRREGYTTTTPR